jgi:hypothetical protein
VFRLLGARLWPVGRIAVPRAQAAFDAGGALVDDKVREALRAFLKGYVDDVAASRRRAP